MGYDINSSIHSSIKKFVQKFTKKYQNVMTCRLQPLDSSLFSHYCLYYTYCKCLDVTAKNITNMPSAQWIKCSVPMLFDITDIVNECQNCKKN